MPAHPCRWPTCAEYVAARGEYCAAHAEQGREAGPPSRHQFYDRHRRNREAKRFYDSAEWKRARAAKLAADPVCEYRGCIALAEHVHHRTPLERCTAAQRTARENLMSLCPPDHNKVEAEAARAGEPAAATGGAR